MADRRVWITSIYRSRARLPCPRDRADSARFQVTWTGNISHEAFLPDADPWGGDWRLNSATGLPYSSGKNQVDEGGLGDDLVVYPLWSTPYVAWKHARPFFFLVSLFVVLSTSAQLMLSRLGHTPRIVASVLLGLGLARILAVNWPLGLLEELDQTLLVRVRVAAPVSLAAALSIWTLLATTPEALAPPEELTPRNRPTP